MWKYLSIGILLLSSFLGATEHLEPEDSRFSGIPILDEYNWTVITAFDVNYDFDVKAKVIVMPSFHPEYALGIKKINNDYTVFHYVAEMSYWGYTSLKMMKSEVIQVVEDGELQRDIEGIKKIESTYPGDFRDIKINRCEASLTPALAIDIIELWNHMLLKTTYAPEYSGGPDGVTYHFSNNSMAGQTWSPNPKSEPGKLVDIVRGMISYCNKTNEASILESKVKEFRKYLKMPDREYSYKEHQKDSISNLLNESLSYLSQSWSHETLKSLLSEGELKKNKAEYDAMLENTNSLGKLIGCNSLVINTIDKSEIEENKASWLGSCKFDNGSAEVYSAFTINEQGISISKLNVNRELKADEQN